MEVPKTEVNLLSEFIASQNNFNKLFTPEILEKMKNFQTQ